MIAPVPVHCFSITFTGNNDMYESAEEFEIQPDPTAEVAALESLKNSPYTYNWKNGVATFSQLFLIRSFTYLQVMMTYMSAWTSSNFGQI